MRDLLSLGLIPHKLQSPNWICSSVKTRRAMNDERKNWRKLLLSLECHVGLKVTERKTSKPEFLTVLWKHHNRSAWLIANFPLLMENDTPNLFISLFFRFLEQMNMIPHWQKRQYKVRRKFMKKFLLPKIGERDFQDRTSKSYRERHKWL